MVWHRWGSGPSIVLLHGGYGSWTHWVRNVEALAARYTVLAADLPGLGDSAMPPQPYDAESIARIVMDGLDDVLGRDGRYHLVGFSFGAALAGVMGRTVRDRVRSVTVVGPSGLDRLGPPVELRAWRHLPPPEQLEAHRDNLATLMLADPAAIDDDTIALQGANARRARLRSRPIARTPVLRDALPAIAAPVNAIHGELDPTIHGQMERRERQLRDLRPDIELRVIPGAGHWVQYEAADRFNTALLELLDPGRAAL
jgi:pimeloyl-ACP methyl ester carboxylesterase